MNTKQEVGADSEDQAAEFLKAKGYAVIARNVNFHNLGELDIVCKHEHNGQIVFVEVRTLWRGLSHSTEIMSSSKQSRLARSAQAWLIANGFSEYTQDWRVDLVVVELQSNKDIQNSELHWYRYIM